MAEKQTSSHIYTRKRRPPERAKKARPIWQAALSAPRQETNDLNYSLMHIVHSFGARKEQFPQTGRVDLGPPRLAHRSELFQPLENLFCLRPEIRQSQPDGIQQVIELVREESLVFREIKGTLVHALHGLAHSLGEIQWPDFSEEVDSLV